MALPPNPSYPVQLEIDYPERLSRLLIFVKWLLWIPHAIALYVLTLVVYVIAFLSFFAVLFTGRYPEGMYDFLVGYFRWSARASSYVFLLTDQYPPFSMEDDPNYPVRLEIRRPERIARWRPLVNWLLAIPVYLIMVVLVLVLYVVLIVSWFAILITGALPEPLFNTIGIFLRWQVRAAAFTYWMVEEYPPLVWA